MRTVTAKPATLGELIQYHRQRKNISLSKLQELVGLDKGNLSRIENGEVKRPNFNIVESIAAVLDISSEDIVEQYMEIGHKSNVIYAFLQKAVAECYSPPLITKIATKYLESPKEDTLDLIENLYQMTDSLEDTSIQLSLYSLIIDYSRAHGIMPYIAKGLYQKYMIERNDFTRVDKSYQSGKKTLDYTNFLNGSEKVKLHYALSVHAYSLMDYNDAIKLGNYVAEYGTGEYQAHAVYNICSAYYHLQQYEACQANLKKYNKFPYSFVPNSVKLMLAFINGKTGNVDLAITQLNEYLHEPSPYTLTSAVTELLQLYLDKNEPDAAKRLFQYEDQMTEATQTKYATPYIKARLAYYYQLKGQLFKCENQINSSINNYLKSASDYFSIACYKEASSSLLLVAQAMINDSSLKNQEAGKRINSLIQTYSTKIN